MKRETQRKENTQKQTKSKLGRRQPPAKKRHQGTPYDDVFHTLLADCPGLIIPVINEVFGKQYRGDEQVIRTANEHYIKRGKRIEKRVSDGAFTILGEAVAKYLLECQSRADNSMTVRMFEYLMQEAAETGLMEKETLHVQIASPAILFLRSTYRTPDEMTVWIHAAETDMQFTVKVLKMRDYSMKELLDKSLYFLIPFYIFNFEKYFAKYNSDQNELEELKQQYAAAGKKLDEMVAKNRISYYDRSAIIDMTGKVVQAIAGRYEKLVEGVTQTMGGRILDYPTKTIFRKGRREGIRQALEIQARRQAFPAESYEKTARVLHCSVDEVQEIVEYRAQTWDTQREAG